MRFKLTLRPLAPNQEIMFNYQYAISSWIYGLIASADQNYATFLHSKGYPVPGTHKSFKDFVFSGLIIPKMERPKPGDTAMRIRCEELYLFINFCVDQSAEKFIIGLFQHQQLSVFNRDHRADFEVNRIESMQPEAWENKSSTVHTLLLRAASPIVIAEKDDRGTDQYLSPDHEAFGNLLAINLADKYTGLEQGLRMDASTASSLIKFRLLSDQQIKHRLFTIKERKDNQTRVRGYYNFLFELTAPTSILRVALYSGIGKYAAAAGCGYVEEVRS